MVVTVFSDERRMKCCVVSRTKPKNGFDYGTMNMNVIVFSVLGISYLKVQLNHRRTNASFGTCSI